MYPNFQVMCNEYEFKCADGRQCIAIDSECDGSLNCWDGSDETGCEGKFDQTGNKL